MIPAAHRTGNGSLNGLPGMGPLGPFTRRHGHGVLPPPGNIYAQEAARANGALPGALSPWEPRNGRAVSHGSSHQLRPMGKGDWSKPWQNGEGKARNTPRKRFQQPKKRKAEEMDTELNFRIFCIDCFGIVWYWSQFMFLDFPNSSNNLKSALWFQQGG